MRRTDLALSVLFYAALVAMMLFANTAFATSTQQPQQNQGQTQGQGQLQAQGQLQGQGQAQSTQVKIGVSSETRSAAAAFAGGGAGGNSVASGGSATALGGSSVAAGGSAGGATSSNDLTINEAAAPGKVEIKNVPDVTAPNVYPTAPCMGSSSIGGSGVGFGITVGTSWESEECMIGETARGFEQAGYKADAMAVRCQGKYAKVAPSCKALQQ